MVRRSRRVCRLLQSALAGLYGSICRASFGLGMGGCDSSRRPATNSGNIPGSFEFCKAVRSGGPLPPLRRANFVGFSFAVVLCATDRGTHREEGMKDQKK